MNMTQIFDRLADNVNRAIEELRGKSPTDALATLEKAKREADDAKQIHRQQLHLEFWK